MSKVVRLSDVALQLVETYRRDRIKQLNLLSEVYGMDPEQVRATILDLERMSDSELLVSALDFACQDLQVDLECLSNVK